MGSIWRGVRDTVWDTVGGTAGGGVIGAREGYGALWGGGESSWRLLG